jgi:hypothetical protein
MEIETTTFRIRQNLREQVIGKSVPTKQIKLKEKN